MDGHIQVSQRPGATVLARMVARVRERVATRLWSRLARMLDDDTAGASTPSSTCPTAAECAASSSCGARRRPSPPAPWLRQWRGSGTCVPLMSAAWTWAGLPPARIAALARHAATARAGDLAQLAPERRAATLIAFAHVGETRAVDDEDAVLDRVHPPMVPPGAVN